MDRRQVVGLQNLTHCNCWMHQHQYFPAYFDSAPYDTAASALDTISENGSKCVHKMCELRLFQNHPPNSNILQNSRKRAKIKRNVPELVRCLLVQLHFFTRCVRNYDLPRKQHRLSLNVVAQSTQCFSRLISFEKYCKRRPEKDFHESEQERTAQQEKTLREFCSCSVHV